MSDSSTPPSVPYTKSSIQQGDRKQASNMSLRSPSAQPAKDEFIDQYRTKMGDLLSCQQELCAVKAQLELARKQEQEGRIREESYQNSLTASIQRIRDLECISKTSAFQADQIDRLRQNEENLKQIIEEQNRQLAQRDLDLAKQREAMEVLQQSHKSEKIELEQQFRHTNQEIKQLKRENEELQRSHAAANDSIAQQQQELNELTEAKEELEVRHQKLKEKKKKLKSQLRHSSDESLIQHTKIAEQHTQIQFLQTQKEKYKEKCAVLVKTEKFVEKQKEIIANLEADLNGLRSQLEATEAKLAKESRKNRIAQGLFAKLATLVGNPEAPKDIVQNIGLLYQETTRLRTECERIPELESACEVLKTEKQDLSETINKLNRRLAASTRNLVIGKAIEQARRAAIQELHAIGRGFGIAQEEPSLRSVIVTAIIGIRLTKFEREMARDNRNWWWLSRKTTTKLSKQLLKSANALNSLQEQNDALTVQIDRLSNEAMDVEARKRAIDAKSIEYEQSVQFLRGEIKRLNEELSSLIDSETFESLKAESLDRKRKLKAAAAELRALSIEKQSLAEQLEEANSACQDQTIEIATLHEELETSQARIGQLTEELQLLQKVQLVRTKELLSLERGIKKEHVTNDRTTAQCQALAFENQQLFNQMNPAKRERHSGDAIRLGFRSTKTLL